MGEPSLGLAQPAPARCTPAYPQPTQLLAAASARVPGPGQSPRVPSISPASVARDRRSSPGAKSVREPRSGNPGCGETPGYCLKVVSLTASGEQKKIAVRITHNERSRAPGFGPERLNKLDARVLIFEKERLGILHRDRCG